MERTRRPIGVGERDPAMEAGAINGLRHAHYKRNHRQYAEFDHASVL